MSTSIFGNGSEPPTPEQAKILEINRLKAKAKVIAREKERLAAEVPNAHNKRPLEVTPADSTSPTAPNVRHFPSQLNSSRQASAALQNALAGPSNVNQNARDRSQTPAVASRSKTPGAIAGNGLGIVAAAKDSRGKEIRTSEFVDYDLSTLKNSKGGFLLMEEEDDPRIARQRRLEEERKAQRLQELAKHNATMLQDPALTSERINERPKCRECGSIELDFQIMRIFGVPVCPKCKIDHPDKYSLLTKTECKEDYLLTDPELKDEELLPHILKPNPHRSTYSNMMLFLRCQVEDFAFGKKWGSAEALDAEFERRQEEKKRKKGKKFEQKLAELRKRTKTNLYNKRIEEAHVHDFQIVRDENGQEKEVCDCGLAVDVESF